MGGFHKLILFFTLAGLVLGGFACEKSFHNENERYVFVAFDTSIPYWHEAQNGFNDAGRVLGVKVSEVGPTAYSPQDELAAFKQAVASNPSGILVSPSLAGIFNPEINEAIAKGIPVICADSDAPDSHRLMFIGTDNFRAGQESAKHLATLLHGQGDIVIITVPGQTNLGDRLKGAQQVLQGYPKIKVLQTLDDKGDPTVANDEVSNLLEQKKEKIDGFLCLEAAGGPGAAETLHRLSMKGKVVIVAMDKSPETLDWISRGYVSGAIAQKPYTMAFYGLRFLDDLHHNVVRQFKSWRTSPESPLPSWVDTGTAWIDSSNVNSFIAAQPTRNPMLE
ncbi:MAG TPA: substrate-binding domain-containing protein [Terriglobia bacterium]|nr:substrate-binding domain-containing protein [Terriglobia bacterium]